VKYLNRIHFPSYTHLFYLLWMNIVGGTGLVFGKI